MGKVSVTLNGRTYRLQCGDGEEQRLIALAAHVGHCLDGVAAEFGPIGDEQLLIMTALMLADELWETREQLARLEAIETKKRVPPPLPGQPHRDAKG